MQYNSFGHHCAHHYDVRSVLCSDSNTSTVLALKTSLNKPKTLLNYLISIFVKIIRLQFE